MPQSLPLPLSVSVSESLSLSQSLPLPLSILCLNPCLCPTLCALRIADIFDLSNFVF